MKAFINMYNRFRQNEKEILDYTLSNLQFLKSKITNRNSELTDIDSELAKLSEQNSLYTRLREKDIMDYISYMEQTAELQKRIAVLRSRRIKILSNDDEERCIEDIRELKQLLTYMPLTIFEYDHTILKKLIKAVSVGRDDVLTFELFCGIKLKERIIWS